MYKLFPLISLILVTNIGLSQNNQEKTNDSSNKTDSMKEFIDKSFNNGSFQKSFYRTREHFIGGKTPMDSVYTYIEKNYLRTQEAFLFYIYFFSLDSQKQDSVLKQFKNKGKEVPPDSFELNQKQLFAIQKNKFSSVVNSSGKNTIGNYASVDVNNGLLAFNATKVFGNGNILSINAHGGITNGFLVIFDQSNINSNVGIDFKYNILFLKKYTRLSYGLNEVKKLMNTIKKANISVQLCDSINKSDQELKIGLSKAIEKKMEKLKLAYKGIDRLKANMVL